MSPHENDCRSVNWPTTHVVPRHCASMVQSLDEWSHSRIPPTQCPAPLVKEHEGGRRARQSRSPRSRVLLVPCTCHTDDNKCPERVRGGLELSQLKVVNLPRSDHVPSSTRRAGRRRIDTDLQSNALCLVRPGQARRSQSLRQSKPTHRARQERSGQSWQSRVESSSPAMVAKKDPDVVG